MYNSSANGNKERKLLIVIWSGTVIDVFFVPQYELHCYFVLSIQFFFILSNFKNFK
jgi:hypothetical protein